MRPIGIGEVLRRIIGKSIISVIRPDIVESAGNLQLCAGQPAGCEAAAHAMEEIFQEERTDAILLIDASNAFNALNRKVMLHNIKYICPPMATYIRNCYCTSSRLFVTGGCEIDSVEGTTQGDPLAMPVYAVGITPLLSLINPSENHTEDQHISEEQNKIKQAAFADDFAGCGKLHQLHTWWKKIEQFGPSLGYYPNALKSWLIVKSHCKTQADSIFADTKINITTEGRKYLGGYIGTSTSRDSYIKTLIQGRINQVENLTQIAYTEPQAAYSAFVAGFQHKLTYHIRTIPEMSNLLAPLDQIINDKFIPAITNGHHCSSEERILLSLPVRLGGMSIPIFADISDREFNNSKLACQQLSRNIKEQNEKYQFDAKMHQQTKINIAKSRDIAYKQFQEKIRINMSTEEKRANDLAQMKGASCWLNALPLKSENYTLNKREFYDAICLRYRWHIKYLPSTCACGEAYTIDHAMSCLKGGFIHQRHDEIRDTIANLTKEVCNDVEVEPHLIKLTGEKFAKSTNVQEDARLDFSARNFWINGQRAFFDIRVFNPYAPSHLNKDISTVFLSNEKEKKRAYNNRVVEVEHGSFTPIVLTPYGGCSRETEKFFSTLASKIAKKRDLIESAVIHWLRTKISFTLLRSSILFIRGSRSVRTKYLNTDSNNIEITNETTKINVL